VNRRERLLVIIIAALALLFVVDQFVVSPYLTAYESRSDEAANVEQKLQAARVLVNNQTLIEHQWSQLRNTGLHLNESALRLKTQRGLIEWSAAAGVNITTLVSGRTVEEPPFKQLQFVVTGDGSLPAVVALLESIYASPFPLTVHHMDLTSRDDAGQRVNVRLTVSTLCLTSPQDEPAANELSAPAVTGELL